MIPLSLYVHIPWCLRKCPYCDFNSYGLSGASGANPVADEAAYVGHLLRDLRADLALVGEKRPLQSIFIGGGTPSLFSGRAIGALLNGIGREMSLGPDCEITLEANPSTFEREKFADYRAAGVNRLSIGVQSFSDEKLKALGRVHDSREAVAAIELAQRVGFGRLNLDLMFALPRQSVAEALEDLARAVAFKPEHLSWYQLTLEPNTVFFRQPPPLPSQDHQAEIFDRGREFLNGQGFNQYEVSAWTRGRPSPHNLNYWQFGDYLGIGAGAHGKLTSGGQIFRSQKFYQPQQYQRAAGKLANPYASRWQAVAVEDLPFEFMMNGLRLREGLPVALFAQRTFLNPLVIKEKWRQLQQKGLVLQDEQRFCTSELGFLHLNEVIELFL